MPDESSASEKVAADRPADQEFIWSAAAVVESGLGDGAAVAAEHDDHVQDEEAVDDRVELDLAGQELAETKVASPTAAPDQRVTPSSDRAHGLEAEHWRERAIVWRERAMAAELVAKMLQRNLDDLRANLEDLRRKIDAATADAERTAAITASEPPWRRFVRDVYDKYFH